MIGILFYLFIYFFFYTQNTLFVINIFQCGTFEIVGGKDTSDTVRRILPKILTNDLAKLYNWSGANKKPAFQLLKNIIRLILGKYVV